MSHDLLENVYEFERLWPESEVFGSQSMRGAAQLAIVTFFSSMALIEEKGLDPKEVTVEDMVGWFKESYQKNAFVKEEPKP